MDDLVTWLRAQLDDDEWAARATTALSSGSWRIDGRGEMRDNDGVGVIHAAARIAPADLAHIARHDPARVLAEVDAKRRILDLHVPYPTPQHMASGDITVCSTCGSVDDSPVAWPCPTVRLLALPYADRPGYRDEWRP